MGRYRFRSIKTNIEKRHRHNFKGTKRSEKHYTNEKKEVNDYQKNKKNSLNETQVGISEYISVIPGFKGVIKARYSDFHVNELDQGGNEVILSDLSAPKPKSDSDKEIQEAKLKLKSIITPNIMEDVRKLLSENPDKSNYVSIDVTDLDKSDRTIIHKILKKEFEEMLTTITEVIDEKKIIKCSKGGIGAERNRWSWSGEYVFFAVYKENVDTVQAAADLARYLKLHPSRVNYAGTKDKRAKTTQLFCIKKREPHQIKKAANSLKYLQVGNFEIKSVSLQLGQLKGNRFKIVLRHITGDSIEEALLSLKNKGFINYYGLQRFGNSAAVPTHDIGLAILKEDYKGACELILKPRDGENDQVNEMRKFWWDNRDSKQASAMISNNKFIEKKLLDGLATYGESDYATALHKIPRNMLLLYPHAFQSLIWNKIVSKRIKVFGLNLIVGDLVYDNDDGILNSIKYEDMDILCVEDEATACVNENADRELLDKEILKVNVRPITAEDIALNKFTIFDIALPLPGYDITYPNNILKVWYEEMLQEYGLSSEQLRHKVKTFSLSGAYRKVITKPEDMSWFYKQYSSPTCNLIVSEYEKLQGHHPEPDDPNGLYKALILDFKLPPSSYATMALREILKEDTSGTKQNQINEEEYAKSNAAILVGQDEKHADKRSPTDEIRTDKKKQKTET